MHCWDDDGDDDDDDDDGGDDDDFLALARFPEILCLRSVTMNRGCNKMHLDGGEKQTRTE